MCKKQSRTNRKFKRREIFKIMSIVEKKIRKEEMFTSLDIVNKLKSKNYEIKGYKVANILSMLLEDEEYPELTTTKINVVRFDGEVVKATLYHTFEADPLDYMNINQQKKPERTEVDFEVDFAIDIR